MTQKIALSQDSTDFEALSFEQKHHRDFNRLQKSYFECEIDEQNDEDFGKYYRVWDNRILLGTFYFSPLENIWVANPCYLNLQYIKTDKDLSQTFDTYDLATKYISDLYTGKLETLLLEK